MITILLILYFHVCYHVLQFLLLLDCQITIIHGVHNPYITGAALAWYAGETLAHPFVLTLNTIIGFNRGRVFRVILFPGRWGSVANIFIYITVDDNVPGDNKLFGAVLSFLQETA